MLYPLSEGRSGEQSIPTALVLEDSVIACCMLCPPTYIATIYVLLIHMFIVCIYRRLGNFRW